MRSTVDRLDKPSAYYLGKASHVSSASLLLSGLLGANEQTIQNKKRKYNRDRDDRDDRDRTPEEPEDPLKDATTLYVGNLSVKICCLERRGTYADAVKGHSTQPKSRFTSCLLSTDLSDNHS